MLVLCTLGQKTQLGNNYITAFRIAGTVVAYVKISLCYPYFFWKYFFRIVLCIHRFCTPCLVAYHSGPEKLKKVQAKKTREIK